MMLLLIMMMMMMMLLLFMMMMTIFLEGSGSVSKRLKASWNVERFLRTGIMNNNY